LIAVPEWAALAVGWAEDAAPVLFRGIKKGGQTASNTKKCGAGLAGSANGFKLVDGYAATFSSLSSAIWASAS
jgi:hypothetical protein